MSPAPVTNLAANLPEINRPRRLTIKTTNYNCYSKAWQVNIKSTNRDCQQEKQPTPRPHKWQKAWRIDMRQLSQWVYELLPLHVDILKFAIYGQGGSLRKIDFLWFWPRYSHARIARHKNSIGIRCNAYNRV